MPLAYFISFSTYGSHLPGDSRGWVDADHNIHGTPVRTANSVLLDTVKQQGIVEYALDSEQQRQLVLEALMETCRFRGWCLIAAHIRIHHAHFLVKAECPPEKVLTAAKANATRILKEYLNSREIPIPAKFWAAHGSTRYVWDAKDLDPLTHYIYHEKGVPMSRFCLNPDPHDAPRNTHGWEK